MAKFIDFKTIMGKLGNHPSILTIEQSIALFNQGMQLPKGANIVEHGPDGGRSTVILAAVARNLDGKLYVFTDWQGQQPQAQKWFEQAVKTHRISSVTSIDPAVFPAEASLTVMRVEKMRPAKGKVLVLGEMKDVPKADVIERGPGWVLLSGVEAPSEVLRMEPPRIATVPLQDVEAAEIIE